MKLSTREVEGFLAAQAFARRLAQAIADKLEPGMSEVDAYSLARDEFQRAGVRHHWHLPYIGLGRGTCKLSSLSSLAGSVFVMKKTRLGQTDVAMVDIAPEYEGYPSDYTVTRVVGRSPDFEAMVRFSQQLAQDLVASLAKGIAASEAVSATERAVAQRPGYTLGLPPLIHLGHRVERLPRGWPRFAESRLLYLLARWRHPFIRSGKREAVKGVWAVEPYVLGHGRAAKHEELVVFADDGIIRLNPDRPS